VKYDKKVLVEVVKKYHPDWRKTLNELQRYGMSGNIDLGALSTITDDSFSTLVNLVRNKNFTDARQWVGENNNIDAEVLIRKFYDHSLKYLEPIQAAQLIQILGEWQFRSVSVPDQEINNMAHITEIMASVTYK
jgi:replication factor C small subunit